MAKKEFRQKLTTILFIFVFFLPLSYVSAEVILPDHKFAWSNNVGYINFEDVIVEDDALSGFAWSANTGFINFSPLQAGVLNDGTGNLSGFAWGEGLGYIDFDNVSINGATGQFSGTASGTLVGIITFDCNFCDVETDWRAAGGPTPPPAPAPTPSSSSIIGSSRRIPEGSVPPLFPDTGEVLPLPEPLETFLFPRLGSMPTYPYKTPGISGESADIALAFPSLQNVSASENIIQPVGDENLPVESELHPLKISRDYFIFYSIFVYILLYLLIRTVWKYTHLR